MSDTQAPIEFVEMAHAPEAVNKSQRGPGEILRNARFALNKDIVDVAKELRLSRFIISALESDEYEKLPGTTFARGYLRAYARIVGLPGDDIIERFNTLYAKDDDDIANPSMESPVKRTKNSFNSNESVLRLSTYAIAVALVGLVFMWWHGQTNDRSGLSVVDALEQQQQLQDADDQQELALAQQEAVDEVAESEQAAQKKTKKQTATHVAHRKSATQKKA